MPVTVKVTNPENSVKSWWSKKNVENVVDLATTGGWQKPFRYDELPLRSELPGRHRRPHGELLLQRLRGGDVATTVALNFSATYTVTYSSLRLG